MQGVAVILVGFAALFLSFEPVWSAERLSAAFLKPSDARSGSLLLKTEEGYADASRLGIDVDLTVSGPTVRARVTQIFRNPTKDWVEAVYVYPLPSGGAVDTLKMVIGDRVVVGDIKERQQARDHLRTGEAERTEGGADRTGTAEHLHQLASPISAPAKPCWCRSNIRSRCSNPATSSRCGCRWWSRPATIPCPSCRASTSGPMAAAGVRAESDPVPDRNRISPEVLDPATNAPVNPTSITVRLQAGFPLGEVKSHHHTVKTEKPDASTQHYPACRRPGAGGSRFRADLEARGREGAIGRAVPRARRRQRLPAGLRHAAGGRTGRSKSRCRAK